jgi:hypothetical protein
VEQGDRRTFAVECRQPIPSKKYFDTLSAILDKPSVLKRFFDYLMEKDVSQVDWIKDRPHTEFLTDLKLVSRDLELSFVVEMLQKNSDVAVVTKSAKDLHCEFVGTFCRDMGTEYKTNGQKFGIKIKNYKIAGFSTKKNNKGTVYIFDTKAGLEWCVEQGHTEQPDVVLPRLLGTKVESKEVFESDSDSDNPNLPPM